MMRMSFLLQYTAEELLRCGNLMQQTAQSLECWSLIKDGINPEDTAQALDNAQWELLRQQMVKKTVGMLKEMDNAPHRRWERRQHRWQKRRRERGLNA